MNQIPENAKIFDQLGQTVIVCSDANEKVQIEALEGLGALVWLAPSFNDRIDLAWL